MNTIQLLDFIQTHPVEEFFPRQTRPGWEDTPEVVTLNGDWHALDDLGCQIYEAEYKSVEDLLICMAAIRGIISRIDNHCAYTFIDGTMISLSDYVVRTGKPKGEKTMDADTNRKMEQKCETEQAKAYRIAKAAWLAAEVRFSKDCRDYDDGGGRKTMEPKVKVAWDIAKQEHDKAKREWTLANTIERRF